MGQRANYIIKEKGAYHIYYTHWRANKIVFDLLKGPTTFEAFVKQQESKETFVDYPWLEGAILMDKDTKTLCFWDETNLWSTSVIQKYLTYLQNIWKDWEITYAIEEMGTIEQLLKIDYISTQTEDFGRIMPKDLQRITPVEKESATTVIILKKETGELAVHYLSTFYLDSFLLLGNTLIDFLLSKESSQDLLLERDAGDMGGALIDLSENRIILGVFQPKLREHLLQIWANWDIHVETLGYLNLLQHAGVTTESLQLSEAEVKEALLELTIDDGDFDARKITQQIMKEFDEYVKPSSQFSENTNS